MNSDYKSSENILEEAIAQHQQGNLENACLLYLDVLDNAHESPLVHFNLGLALYEMEQYEESSEYYLNALEYAPEEPDILYNLALCLKKREKHAEAIALFRRILEVAPADADTLYNIACCYTDIIDDDKAIYYYTKTLEIDDSHQSAINNLAYVYHRNEDFTNAAVLYHRLLELDPTNQSARHMLDSLKGVTRDRAPVQYVKEVFDEYSEYFEENLLSQLEYYVPYGLRETFDTTYPYSELYHGLDLGCGTGLCGETFSDLCSTLTGVDISPRMIEAAGKKQIYSDLKTQELVRYLLSCTCQFDLILAADVFSYLGDLSDIIEGVAGVAKKGGRFCFSVEESEHEDFRLRKTGRFAHSTLYIFTVLEKFGWRIDRHIGTDLRKDGSDWIRGRLFFATRI